MTRLMRPARFGSALVAAGVAMLALTLTAAGAQTVTIIGTGGSDELVPPPSPTCDDLVFITEVSFDAEGNPIDIPRFGSTPDLTQVFDVPGFEPVGPGAVELNEVIVYDGHFGRVLGPAQLQEQVFFEFLLDGVVQATTPLTPDVPDAQRTGWHDVDMGIYEVPNGADTLRIRHVGGDPAEINSVVVSALCGRFVETQVDDDQTTTTEPPATTEAPTTTEAATTTEAPSTTEAVTTTEAPSTTEAPTTTVATEVLQDTETRDDLANTGAEHRPLVAAALGAIAAGMALVAVGNRRSATSG